MSAILDLLMIQHMMNMNIYEYLKQENCKCEGTCKCND